MILQRVRSHWALLSILALAFALRIWGIDFGLPFFLHPDETKIVEPGITMAFGFKEALLAGDLYFFDPDFFFYPSFLMYLLMGGIIFLKAGFVMIDVLPFVSLSFAALPKSAFYLLARFISVLFGTATVWVVYRIAEELHSRTAGLLSALLLSVAFLHVKNSHYYTGDVAATFFITVALLWLLRSYDRGKGEWFLYASAVAIGVGIATKYYPFLVLFPLGMTVLFQQHTWDEKVKRTLASGMLASFTFFLLVPFSLLNFPLFLQEQVVSSQRSATGVFGYVNDDFLYYLTSREPSFHEPFTHNSLVQGLGVPLLFLSVIALLYWAYVGRKERILVGYVVLHYLFFATNLAKIVRWMMPLVPVAAVLVALLLLTFRERFQWSSRTLGLLVALLMIPNLYHSVLINHAFSQTDTRVQAYEWTEEHIPDQSTVVFEYFTVPQFTRRSLNYVELDHPRYNINGEIAASRPPAFSWIRDQVRPDFLIINGAVRDRFATQSMQEAFPEAAEAWRSLYDSIDREYTVAARFTPHLYDNVRAGPEVVIYSKERESEITK